MQKSKDCKVFAVFVFILLVFIKIKICHNMYNEDINMKADNNFIFSKAVRAGKRIYYFDVKKNGNSDKLYISITESKKNMMLDSQNSKPEFSKQRLLVYKEDFSKFFEAMIDCMEFIEKVSEYSSEVVEKDKFVSGITHLRKNIIEPDNINFDI